MTITSEDPGKTPMSDGAECRFCGAPLRDTFVDLGPQPLCESYVAADDAERMEPFYPLHVRICRSCLLVQLPALVDREAIFREYAYFSSYSDSWVEHARRYTDAMIDRMGLTDASLVVELASNDGYLLQHFVSRGIPVLGIEPAHNVAVAAEARGVPTLTEFFGRQLAEELRRDRGAADLVVGNNVLAQVPDINDFVAGIAILLAPGGLATLEFPHVVRLVEGVQFDTIYHEHFSYFSLTTVTRIARRAWSDRVRRRGVADARRFAARLSRSSGRWARRRARRRHAARTRADGWLRRVSGYSGFEERVREAKRALLTFLIEARVPGSPLSAMGRLAKATRCSTTAGYGPTSSTTRLTGIPTSRAGSRPVRGSRSAIRHDWRRHGRT